MELAEFEDRVDKITSTLNDKLKNMWIKDKQTHLEIQHLKARLNSAGTKSNCDQYTKKIKKLELELKSVQTEHETQIDKMNKRMTQLNTNFDQMTIQENEINNKKKEINTLVNKIGV